MFVCQPTGSVGSAQFKIDGFIVALIDTEREWHIKVARFN